MRVVKLAWASLHKQHKLFQNFGTSDFVSTASDVSIYNIRELDQYSSGNISATSHLATYGWSHAWSTTHAYSGFSAGNTTESFSFWGGYLNTAEITKQLPSGTKSIVIKIANTYPESNLDGYAYMEVKKNSDNSVVASKTSRTYKYGVENSVNYPENYVIDFTPEDGETYTFKLKESGLMVLQVFHILIKS